MRGRHRLGLAWKLGLGGIQLIQSSGVGDSETETHTASDMPKLLSRGAARKQSHAGDTPGAQR